MAQTPTAMHLLLCLTPGAAAAAAAAAEDVRGARGMMDMDADDEDGAWRYCHCLHV
jgi:hypothetical protein